MKHAETLEQFLERAAQVLFPTRPWDGEPKNLSVKTKSCLDETPLHLAALWGDRHAINLLLEAGAEVDAKGEMSCSPLYWAVTNNHILCAEALLKHGSNPDAKNELNETPRQNAERINDKAMIALFKKHRQLNKD